MAYNKCVTHLHIDPVMSHRINVILDDEVWRSLSQLPKGERSRLINNAIARELLRQQRRRAMEEMDRLRKTPRLTKETAEELVRRDRERDQ
jgi:hypothetical protein